MVRPSRQESDSLYAPSDSASHHPRGCTGLLVSQQSPYPFSEKPIDRRSLFARSSHGDPAFRDALPSSPRRRRIVLCVGWRIHFFQRGKEDSPGTGGLHLSSPRNTPRFSMQQRKGVSPAYTRNARRRRGFCWHDARDGYAGHGTGLTKPGTARSPTSQSPLREKPD
jgi:hypothetical protein